MLINWKYEYFLIFFLLHTVYSLDNSSFCQLLDNPIPIDLQLNAKLEFENKNSKLLGIVRNSIRFKFEYTEEFNRYIHAAVIKTNFIGPAQKILQDIIGVKYVQNSPLKVPRRCPSYVMKFNKIYCTIPCPDLICATIVPKYLYSDCLYIENGAEKTLPGGTGAPETDIVIMVTYDGCRDALAKASPCARGLKGRAILGQLIICEKFYKTNILNPKMNINVIIHEILHILAFSADNMLYFVNSKGEPIIPLNEFGRPSKTLIQAGIFIQNSRKRGAVGSNFFKSFLSLNTSKAITFARKHFQCQNLNGIDLEDENGYKPGHIDELVYGTEIMTAIGDGVTPMVLSGLTLSILEDSGWYNIDYQAAEILVYGANLGCQFALDGCYNYMVNKNYNSITPFCQTVFNSDIFCSRNQQFIAYCDLKRTGLNNQKFIYFKHLEGVADQNVKSYSGSTQFNEYCPVLRAFEINSQSSECFNSRNKQLPNMYFLENYYGSDSMCLNNLITPPPSNKLYGATCFQIKSKNLESFVFLFKQKQYSCNYYTVLEIKDGSNNIKIDCGPKSPLEVYWTIHDNNTRPRRNSLILKPMNFILIMNIVLFL